MIVLFVYAYNRRKQSIYWLQIINYTLKNCNTQQYLLNNVNDVPVVVSLNMLSASLKCRWQATVLNDGWNPWTDRYKILHAGCRPGRNHAYQFLGRSVKGLWCGDGSNFGLFHWLALSPLKHSRTTVRVCDKLRLCTSHTRTVVRKCFKGDEASQWKRPKFDPSPHHNPLTDLPKNW